MIDMDAMLAFARAQLDEDERLARSAAESLRCGCHPGTYAGDWAASEARVYTELHDVAGGDSWPAAINHEVAEHIARWDPARVLRLTTALRGLIDDLHWEARELYAVQALTEALYADRPGYHEDWRP